mgnify:CR=1 FL=1
MRAGAPLGGLLAGVAAHAVHNASVTLGAELGWPCLFAFISNWGGAAFLLAVIVWSSIRERRWIERWLEDEVTRGTLSRDDYEVIGSSTARVAERAAALLSGDLERWRTLGRYYRLATELAFTKRRRSRFPEEVDTGERVDRLRERVEALDVELGA